MSIAARYDVAAAYDAHYLALAARLDCRLFTADSKLMRLGTDSGAVVTLAGGPSA